MQLPKNKNLGFISQRWLLRNESMGKRFQKLRHISHKTSTKITIVKKYGLPFYLFDHRRRKLFFAGIFAATVLLLIMSGYIWDIEILGTHTQTEEVIRTFLKENHVNTGIRRGNIDCRPYCKRYSERI